ncbi:hypothetical protein S40285_10160 [Stachybotrys chlorohalonatus IBT 40285]|uniref:Uncharacterized protein n=1 Tax=Stachybotrys chlorohalonatus (strain IBT 40285) TaxID=1283841 RepID=A0A084QKY2_STAC4|nr:hypothetical protein S40285_10160 [Stachybotrys chlorohalonata IBT 40285]
MSSHDFSDTRSVLSVPPPYTELPSASEHHLGESPQYTSAQPARKAPPQPTAQPAPAAEASRSSPFSLLKDAVTGRRAASAAQRKVDYYEKTYGFVPKNAMTEEEWRRAREAAPKIKKKTQWGSKMYMGPPPT